MSVLVASAAAAATVRVNVGGASVTPLWFANHENSSGDHTTQWETAVHAGGSSGGGGFFNSGTELAARSTNFAHSATRSVRAEVEPVGGAASGVRAFRWAESETGQDLYYSCWYYFPDLYTVGGGTFEFWNIAQFKAVNATRNDPTWSLEIINTGLGDMRIDMVHHGQQLLGAGLSFRRFTQTLNPTDVPVGQWVHIEQFLHQATITQAAASNGSIIRTWQDGVMIFEIGPGLSTNESLPTHYDDGETQWSINNYTDGTTPNPTVIYLDDAVIADESVYGKTVVGL